VLHDGFIRRYFLANPAAHHCKKPLAMWKQKLALALFSTLFTLLAVAAVGHFIKIEGDTLNKKIVLKGWFLKERWLGPSKIGIFQPDSIFGWTNKPLSTGSHFFPYSFHVRYHIDGQGHRITRGGYDRPKVLFLGCSFTFGHGVEDEEAYPALLGEHFTPYKMVNAAAPAWGTVQAYLKLEQQLALYDDVDLVVYGFINHHLQRNYLRKEWLDRIGLGRKNPHLEVRDGKLEHLGLSDPEQDGIADDNLLAIKEKELTLALLAAMQAACETRQIPFLVVNLPEDGAADFKTEILSVVGPDRFLDLRSEMDFPAIQLPIDGHPNAEGHRQIAKLLTPFLENHLQRAAQRTGLEQ